MRAPLTDAAVSARTFPALEFIQRAMHTDEEHIERLEEAHAVLEPRSLFQNVLHDQGVACGGERSDGTVKSVEKTWTNLTPTGLTFGTGAVQRRHYLSVNQLI